MIEQRKRNRGQGGFTLIELLVVIAILAILAGVAVFAVGNLTQGADESACKLEKDTLNTANQAALAKGGGATVSDYLDAGTVTVSGGNVTGKYWTVSDTAASANSPTYSGPTPAACS